MASPASPKPSRVRPSPPVENLQPALSLSLPLTHPLPPLPPSPFPPPALRALGKRVFFVTNNSTKTRADYVHKLMDTAGIACAPEDVISSAFAAAVYCKREGITRAYVVGQSGLVKELQDIAGVTSLGLEDWGKEFSFGTLDPATHLDKDVQAVVIGFDNRFTYYKLATAAMYLRSRPEVRFVATNADASYPDTHGFVPGGGSLVAALQTGSGRKPDIVAGKPNPVLLDLIESAKGLTRSRTCMVGDRLDTDMLFGNGGGLRSTLLVLTGVSSVDDAAARPEGDKHRPTHYVDSFGTLGALAKASGMV
jgi:phosphoglycolate/pyridoxal phosphate phosphatase family enzyme